jgi:hypothetical protein
VSCRKAIEEIEKFKAESLKALETEAPETTAAPANGQGLDE